MAAYRLKLADGRVARTTSARRYVLFRVPESTEYGVGILKRTDNPVMYTFARLKGLRTFVVDTVEGRVLSAGRDVEHLIYEEAYGRVGA